MSIQPRITRADSRGLAFVRDSAYRREALLALQWQPDGLTPRGIAERRGLRADVILDAVGDLLDAGLVEHADSEPRKRGPYRLTEQGSRVAGLARSVDDGLGKCTTVHDAGGEVRG